MRDLHKFPMAPREKERETHYTRRQNYTSYRDRRVDGAKSCALSQFACAWYKRGSRAGENLWAGSARPFIEDGGEFRIARRVRQTTRGAKYPLADARSAEKLFLFPMGKKVGPAEARNARDSTDQQVLYIPRDFEARKKGRGESRTPGIRAA